MGVNWSNAAQFHPLYTAPVGLLQPRRSGANPDGAARRAELFTWRRAQFLRLLPIGTRARGSAAAGGGRRPGHSVDAAQLRDGLAA